MLHHLVWALPMSATAAFVFVMLFMAMYRGLNVPMARYWDIDYLPTINLGIAASFPSWVISFHPSWQLGVGLSIGNVAIGLLIQHFRWGGEFSSFRNLAAYVMIVMCNVALWLVYAVQFMMR